MAITAEMAGADFWRDHQAAAIKAAKLDANTKMLQAAADVADILARTGARLGEDYDEADTKQMLLDLDKARETIGWFEAQTMFAGPYDERDAYMFFHVGAGGADAADWNQMLLNMYLRYAQSKGWQVEIVQTTTSEEAGVKNATIKISGYRAYGWLKTEAGVHRLIRLSPFNAQNLRQTSFALIEVLPDLGDVDVELNEDDLKIETFKSSGKGGQSVNTTDSAVRVTHIPTNIVVAIRTERSQMQNKETAIKLLKHRLFLRAEDERENAERKLKAATSSGDFGQQVRSYTLHPYQQVKDHRSGFETSQTDKVLKNGELDEIIMSVLIHLKNEVK